MSINSSSKLQLAIFTPLPPQRSGISDYSRELLPFLAELAEITLFVDNPDLVLDEIKASYVIRPYSDYATTHQQFDIPLYHLGNSSLHKSIYKTFTQFPGLVVLHDYVLHHFFSDQTAWSDLSRYQRELGYNEGIAGTNLGWQTIFAGIDPNPYARPLNGRVLNLSLGLIAHSQFVINKIQQHNPNLPTAKIPQLMPLQKGKSKKEALPFPEDAIIFASIGLITPSKQIEFALRAFAQIAATNSHVYYLLVGDVSADLDLDHLLNTLQIKDRVFYVGYADNLQSFVDWITTTDIIVNLRYPTTGETSATALRAMATGKPIIVFNHGWYAEIAQDACVQLPILDEQALLQSMEKLATSLTLREQIGKRALEYIETICHPKHVAQNYVDFIRTVLQNYGAS